MHKYRNYIILVKLIFSYLNTPSLPFKMRRSLSTNIAKQIKIIEVGPRDGLQNEAKCLSILQRSNLIKMCTQAGLHHIEVGSYIHPKLLPQVANVNEVLDTLYPDSYFYSTLVPSLKYYQPHPLVKEFVLFVAASETFNKKNINTNIEDAFKRFKPVVDLAKLNGIKVRGSISTAIKCPYEGRISEEVVLDILSRYDKLGCHLIDIADTIGEARPEEVYSLLGKAKQLVDISKLTGHYHDNNGNALLNVDASLQHGMTIFHSSIGGLGGCPFSSKRVGNLSTEKLVYYLHSSGYNTGLEEEQINTISKEVCKLVGRE